MRGFPAGRPLSVGRPLSSRSSSGPVGPLSAALADHASARAARKSRLERSVASALSLAGVVENDARACMGMELQSVASNQRVLDASVKGLLKRAAAVSKQVQGHSAQFDGVAASLREVGSLAIWLANVEDALGKVLGDFAAIEASLTAET